MTVDDWMAYGHYLEDFDSNFSWCGTTTYQRKTPAPPPLPPAAWEEDDFWSNPEAVLLRVRSVPIFSCGGWSNRGDYMLRMRTM